MYVCMYCKAIILLLLTLVDSVSAVLAGGGEVLCGGRVDIEEKFIAPTILARMGCMYARSLMMDRERMLVSHTHPYLSIHTYMHTFTRIFIPTYFYALLCALTISEALREEIFGPVRPVFKHRDISEVISFIPQGEKPLALCIFSKSRVRIDSVTSAERQHECMYVYVSIFAFLSYTQNSKCAYLASFKMM